MTAPVQITPAARSTLREMLRSTNAARASNVAQIRAYKNRLIGATLALSATAVALPLIIPLIAIDLGVLRPLPAGAPAGTTALPLTSGDVATIEMWGAVGGLIGLVASLRKLVSTRAPVRLQATQLTLKIPAGALTALFGILIFQAAIMPSFAAATPIQLTAYALVFGFAQEAVTRTVDSRANALLEQGKNTDETNAGTAAPAS
jgi:hypothetical protein